VKKKRKKKKKGGEPSKGCPALGAQTNPLLIDRVWREKRGERELCAALYNIGQGNLRITINIWLMDKGREKKKRG